MEIRKKKSSLMKQIGILIIIFSWFLYGCYYIYISNPKTDDDKIINKINNQNNQEILIDKEVDQDEEIIIEVPKETEYYNYIGILEIPKINLKKMFFDIDDINNDVNKNIQVLKNSIMPNEENSILAIASHAGNGWNAFFKNLYKLELDDDIYVYYDSVKYSYKVINIYNDEKNGTISINKSNKDSLLVLTTCNLTDRTKQRVVIAKMVK